MSQLSIGNELKDSFEVTSKWVQYNLKWLSEIEAFYKERSKLEKEYSDKLKVLTAEYFKKKSVASVSLGVGQTPTVTPGSIEAASVVAWNEILTQTELIAKDHGKLSQDLVNSICGQINGLYTKLDMTYTRIVGFYNEIEKRKNSVYSDLEKSKRSYDDSCQNMELARNKYTKSPNDRNKRKLGERETLMNVAKNSYLIKISQANRIKDKYYFQDIPEVLDLLQDLNEARVSFLNNIWGQASQIEINFGSTLKKRMKAAEDVVKQNKPSLSTAMFIKHNVKSWKEPLDFQFKPSPIWHDDEQFIVSGSKEIDDLKLRLNNSQKVYSQMQDKTAVELEKLAKYNKIKQNLKSNEDTLDSVQFYDNLKNYLTVISGFTSHESVKLLSQVEIESIENNVPSDIDLNIANYDEEKNKSTKRGKNPISFLGSSNNSNNNNNTNRGSSLFSKFKVKNILHTDGASINGGGNHSNRQSTIQDIDTETQCLSNSNDSSTKRNRSNTTTSSAHATNKNKVLYPYEKQDDDEITVHPGDKIELVERDTGSGWTLVRNVSQNGVTGLVPTTYIEIHETSKSANPPTVPPPRRNNNALVRTMTAQYPYQSQGDDELSISPGDVITVIRGDDGSGWTYGELNGAKGLVPTSYCK